MAVRETQPMGGGAPFGVSLELLWDLCFDLFSRFLLSSCEELCPRQDFSFRLICFMSFSLGHL
jgi:hypothetical protein